MSLNNKSTTEATKFHRGKKGFLACSLRLVSRGFGAIGFVIRNENLLLFCIPATKDVLSEVIEFGIFNSLLKEIRIANP